MNKVNCLFCFFSVLIVNSALGQSYMLDDMSSRGEIALESRVFDNDNNPDTEDFGLAFFSRVEARYQNDEFSHVFRGMARVDRKDQNRNFVTIEDAYFSTRLIGGGAITLLAGYKIFNWTATEAFHPADQVNSRNYDGELENLEKKGELTVEMEMPFWQGIFSIFLMPRFEEPKLPPSTSRLGPGIDLERAVVVKNEDATSNEHWVPQFGLLTRQNFSFGDISLHVLRHINRNSPLYGTHDFDTVSVPVVIFPVPIFRDIITPFSTRLTPYYFETTQVGGTFELMLPVVTKIEWAYRMFDKTTGILDLSKAPANPLDGFPASAIQKPQDHGEVAIGFEYPFDHDSGSETYLFLEFNTFLGLDKLERQAQSVFQRDVFFGIRHGLNDFMGREIFLSTIVDLENTNEQLFNISYSQRLSDQWRIKTGIRIYQAKPEAGARPQGLEVLNRADSFNLTLTRYF